MKRANIETDLGIRSSLLQDAETALLADYPIAPQVFYISKHTVKPHVVGFEDYALDRHPSRFLSINFL